MSKHIGSFEIVGRLEPNAGTASYLGRNSTDGGSAIIDIWAPETPEAQAQFLEQASAASRLEHGSIARILDFGIDATTSCRIEQSSDGETLSAMLQRGDDLPRETALSWLTQIARALEYAHGMGAVHGDVHPGMVTIRSDGTVELRGFANPRPTADLLYRAPELSHGSPVDVRTDLYAFGVLLGGLMTHRSGAGQVPSRRLRPSTSQVPPALKDLPADFPRRLITVFEGCLQDDPHDRLRNFTSVVGALEAAIHEAASAAAAPDDPAPTPAFASEPPAEPDWASATVLSARGSGTDAEPIVEIPVQKPTDSDGPLVEVELNSNAAEKNGTPPSLETVAEAIKRPARSRFRRRWLTFAAVAGTALWLGGTLWWSKGSPAVAGAEAPPVQQEAEAAPEPANADAVSAAAVPQVDRNPSGDDDAIAPPSSPVRDDRPASRGIGRLALAPGWHPDITVSVAGGPPVVLDRRRVFEVEAGIDHVVAFELVTRDYQMREQLVTQVAAGRLLETPAPLVRPGSLSVAATEESARPVFVRIGDEAIGWTPIHNLQLPAGAHVLSVFKNPTYRPEERIDQKIRVRSRQQTAVKFDLESEPPALIVDGRRFEHVPASVETAPEATGASAPASAAPVTVATTTTPSD